MNAAQLVEFFANRPPSERYDTVIVQADGRAILTHFERDDADRILDLIEMTPLA